MLKKTLDDLTQFQLQAFVYVGAHHVYQTTFTVEIISRDHLFLIDFTDEHREYHLVFDALFVGRYCANYYEGFHIPEFNQNERYFIKAYPDFSDPFSGPVLTISQLRWRLTIVMELTNEFDACMFRLYPQLFLPQI